MSLDELADQAVRCQIGIHADVGREHVGQHDGGVAAAGLDRRAAGFGKVGEVLQHATADGVRRASSACDLPRAGGELVLERAVDRRRIRVELRLQLLEHLECVTA